MMNPHKAVGSVSLSAFLLQAGAGEQVHCTPALGPQQLPGSRPGATGQISLREPA